MMKKVNLSVFTAAILAILVMFTVSLKPLHELTVHHFEYNKISPNKTFVSEKEPHCPICELQVHYFDQSFYIFELKKISSEIKKSITHFHFEYLEKNVYAKKGRAPPLFFDP
ncbi:hypothetical protein GV828_11950 [Flavobacterium sp. NST-5]|uniref:Uncharacterized protein n=1 Tax=Flavobacterium ichthyis TaxID=2698827 RepID=A0ABW9ZAI0_9FLAO|nr:hypothetical protein [Flavobacterium ichthyis]NBL65913.1 hypothetical protein [Flavobacterium ichthyis]